MNFNKLKEAIDKALVSIEAHVDSINYVKKGKYNFLEIVVDKIGGIDMDTIVEATHIINPIVDELDLIDESYILDISSKERG